jgi:hypothetical protein
MKSASSCFLISSGVAASRSSLGKHRLLAWRWRPSHRMEVLRFFRIGDAAAPSGGFAPIRCIHPAILFRFRHHRESIKGSFSDARAPLRGNLSGPSQRGATTIAPRQLERFERRRVGMERDCHSTANVGTRPGPGAWVTASAFFAFNMFPTAHPLRSDGLPMMEVAADFVARGFAGLDATVLRMGAGVR